MKIFFVSVVMVIALNQANGQCDYSIKVSTETYADKGTILAKLSDIDSYKCVLYAYESGDKIIVEEVSNNSDLVSFENLSLNRYYRVEFKFKKSDDILCSSWVSELIQFNVDNK